MAGLSACGSGDSGAAGRKPSLTPSVSQSATPADPSEAAKKEAIAVYLSYWQEMEKLYADSSGKSANLKSFAASQALSSAEADAKSTHARQLLHTGEVSVGSPTVTKLNMDRKIPNASLSSCLDISRWNVINVETKKPADLPADRLTKFVVSTTVERWPDGWKVVRDEPTDKAC